ncbi:MAG: hypothetical protein K0S41_500 [Anaerocolumna sp.]|jgi:AAA15 family ATPase/GTPase|nr:hypothetical protein [Anaerocolumna sp.]
MGIKQINIRNFKSLQNVSIDFDRNHYDIQCIIGKNGTGKSSILDAIDYFYKMSQNDILYYDSYTDTNNRYIQKMQIEFIYDLDMPAKLSTNDYLDSIMGELIPYIKDGKILLRLTQYKDGNIEWFPSDKNIRKTLSKLFPIYMIDTRFITLEDWSIIWSIIGELSISNIKRNDNKIDKKLDELLDEVYGKKYSKALAKIKNIFISENITINKNNYNERFISALNTRLGGSEFLSDSKKIDYYSDGTNSLKYIKLIVQLVSFLSETGWKNPMIIIDEPEIGLHPQYIEDLVQCIYESLNPRVNFLVTTHSTNLITSLIKNQMTVGLKRVFIKSNYTKLERIKDLVNTNDIFLISNKETECYFSNAILFVEGTTEMQLFQYPRLRELFKIIRYIKFFNYDSNDASLKLIHPNNNKYNVPFIVLIDMDKILRYNCASKKFTLNPDKLVNPLYNKDICKSQKLLYYKKDGRKSATFNKYQYINKVLKTGLFEQNNSLYWLDNRLYRNLNSAINTYCKEYNILPVMTTIEGCLVNIDNYLIVKEWLDCLLEPNNINKLNTLLSFNNAIYYKTTILRLILNGKFDNLLTLDEAKKGGLITKQFVSDIKNLNQFVGKKTSGWINSFLDYYFTHYLDVIQIQNDKLDKFANDFNELNNILQFCEGMVKFNNE